MILAVSVFYGFNAWMPTLLVENGYTTAQSLTFSSIIGIAACPGALLAMLFIDRIERRVALLVINIVVAALLLTFAFVDSYVVLLACGFLLVLIMQAGTACTYAYLPEIFPTRLRGLGAGLGNGAGRLAAFASSFLIASLLAGLGSDIVFIGLGVAGVVAGLVIGIWGERTRDRSLEVISRTSWGTRGPLRCGSTGSSGRIPDREFHGEHRARGCGGSEKDRVQVLNRPESRRRCEPHQRW